jgi:hypothetical protein
MLSNAELGRHSLDEGELREVKEAVFVSLSQSQPEGIEYASFSFAALRDRLARQVAVLDLLPDAERLAQDEHAVGGSQLPLLANTLLLPRRETGRVFRKMLGD